MATFPELGVDSWISEQCAKISVTTPTPIQSSCIPEILKGRHCIGVSETGSGKTLAFALPIIHSFCKDPHSMYAVVLTATRELACQIADQFNLIGRPMNLRTCVVIGGMCMTEQGLGLSRHPHIVVATPGRLADHIESCPTFSLAHVKFVVVDEADRLFSGHFNDQLQTIFDVLPKKTMQKLFFSATMSDSMQTLRGIIGEDGFVYEAPRAVATVERLRQQFVLCPVDAKDVYFVEVLRRYREEDAGGNILVFTDTCYRCQTLSMALNKLGFQNVALHGFLNQRERLATLARFKSNTVKIMIGTDVAGRGLDIPTVSLVINHTLPAAPKEYVHRVGRTARAGRGGRAITLVTPLDVKNNTFKAIEEFVNVKMEEFKVDDKKVCEIYKEVSMERSEARIRLNPDQFYEKKMTNLKKKWIMEGLNPDEEEAKYMKRIRGKWKKNRNKQKAKRDGQVNKKNEKRKGKGGEGVKAPPGEGSAAVGAADE